MQMSQVSRHRNQSVGSHATVCACARAIAKMPLHSRRGDASSAGSRWSRGNDSGTMDALLGYDVGAVEHLAVVVMQQGQRNQHAAAFDSH